jgi:four helix bundle protein
VLAGVEGSHREETSLNDANFLHDAALRAPSTPAPREGGEWASMEVHMMMVYRKSVSVVAGLGAVAKQIGRHDQDLARQLRRACVSMPLNIAEGEHGRGRRKPASFGVALGSARESRACLDVGVALGYLDEGIDPNLCDELDHVIAMLYRLSR